LADVEETDLAQIETAPAPLLSPRTVVNLARACEFSVARFQVLANHVVAVNAVSALPHFRFAARSRGLDAVSAEELEAIRALVEVLSDRSVKNT
jgi:hypothetical protein